MWEKLKGLKHSKPTRKINALLIPVSLFTFKESDIEIFNQIYNFVYNSDFKTIQRTDKGTILSNNIYSMPCYDIARGNNFIEITILSSIGFWRIQFRSKLEEKRLSGRACFTKLKKEFLKDGIDITKYYIENGLEIKKQIEAAPIEVKHAPIINRTVKNAHHIDFHSSYPAGLANAYPELRPTLERLFVNRHKKQDYKAILNLSIGFFQSKIFGYKLSHLTKAAIDDNNKRIKNLTSELEESGRLILAFNTDGIWYAGDVFHSSSGDEGEDLGQWSHDHTNCIIRFKSKGAYEFIENDKYTAVVRGHTNLDSVKPREEWDWGDIYNNEAEVIEYYFIEGEGIVKQDGKG